MNRWFEETFFPSLFQRTGACKSLWLTRRQTQVCVDNMERHTSRFTDRYTGEAGTHISYECDWQGRHVTLEYSKLNGCGAISFGLTAEEAAEAETAHRAERKHRDRERWRRMAAQRPDRFRKYLQEAEEEVRRLEEDLDDDRLDLEEAEANGISEARDSIANSIRAGAERLAEAQARLALMREAVA